MKQKKSAESKKTKLEQILTNSYKVGMISYLSDHPEDFGEAIRLAISDKQPYSWRAAWLLWSCMKENDSRLQEFVKTIIDTIPETSDSQQRDLLIILQKMDIKEEYEGLLFDHCATVWGEINKRPSVRINAFKMMVKIVQKHPELSHELVFLTGDQFINTLSPGVKKSIGELIKGLKK